MFAAAFVFMTILNLMVTGEVTWEEALVGYPAHSLLAIAFGMSVPMIPWMLHRGHSRRPDPEVLVVEFSPEGSANTNDMWSEGSDAYITSSAGERTDSFLYGFNAGEGGSRLGIVGFTPKASTSGFTLHWPGNPPVELGR